MKQYFKLPADKSAEIRADFKAIDDANFALLTRLAGVPIKQVTRTGNLAFALARLESIVSPTVPTEPGWELQKGYQDRYVPCRRSKAGKAIAEAVKDLDLLGILSALDRVGISPYWILEPFGRGGHAGVNAAAPEILLIWDSTWGTRKWPEWVEEIKASEWYAILETATAQEKAV